ncbi:MAG: AAA family ATPase [Burkholderiales bacterium]|nr:AAA family ATPase [Burkholderiales bacterium]
MHLQLLGRPQVSGAGLPAPVLLERKLAALLAMLALEGPQPRARLIARLWPEHESKDPRSALRSRLLSLRKLVGQALVLGDDVLALAAGTTHDLASLPEPAPADAAWPEFLAGLDYGGAGPLGRWVAQQRTRMAEAQRRHQEARVQQLLEAGQSDAAVSLAQALLRQAPEAERPYVRLAQLLHLQGEQRQAREVVAQCLAMLADQRRGASPELQDLMLRVGAGAPGGARPRLVPPAALVHPPTLVGRTELLAAVQAGWRRGRAVLLEGEAGVGKSRLLAELAGGEAGSLRVGAAPGDAPVPYALLKRLLRALHERWPLAHAPWVQGELARLVPELGAAPDRPAYRERFVEALQLALGGWQRAGLTCLLLDDLHWADPSTLEDLLAAWDQLPATAAPRLLLCARSGARPAAVAQWAGRSPERLVPVNVPPLDRDALCTLMQSLREALGVAEMNPLAWATALLPVTQGHPFHVLEALLAQWALHGESALRQRAPRPLAWTVSHSMTQLLDERLARLSEPGLRLARLACVAEAQFSVALAEAVLERFALDLSPVWAELESAGVMQGLGFTHDLLRERLRRSIPQSIAQEIHRRVARAAADAGAPDAAVAMHWLHGDDHAAAAAGFERAARAACRLNLRAEELARWDQAAHCHDHLGAGDAAFDCRMQACAAARVVEPAAAVDERHRWLLRAARRDEQQLAAWTSVATQASERVEAKPWGEAATQAMAALRRLQAAGRPPPLQQEAGAVCVQATWLGEYGQAEAGLALLATLEPRLAACGDLALQQAVAEAMAWVLHRANRVVDARHAAERALQLAEAIDDWAACAAAANNLGGLVAQSGAFARAIEVTRKAQAWTRRLGQGGGLASAHSEMTIAGRLGRLGRYAEALAVAEQAIAAFRDAGALSWQVHAEASLARLYLDLGDPTLARASMPTLPPAEEARRSKRALVALQIERFEGRPVLEGLQALRDPWDSLHPGMRLLWWIELARCLPPDQALPQWVAMTAEAERAGLGAAVQQLRLQHAQCLMRLGHARQAVAALGDVVATMSEYRPFDLHFAEACHMAAEVLGHAGDRPAQQQALRLGLAWLQGEALPQVPAPLVPGFLSAAPGVAALLAQGRLQGLAL